VDRCIALPGLESLGLSNDSVVDQASSGWMMKFLQRVASQSPLLLFAFVARRTQYHNHAAACRQIDGLLPFAHDESICEQLQRLHDVHGSARSSPHRFAEASRDPPTRARKYFG
jgi:hypothetical protein